jgi:DNA-directed RNA polymerase specialized sigma24 family protein
MTQRRALGLLDSNGKPLDGRIEHVLVGLLPRLQREFPVLRDEVELTQVLETAGRSMASVEERDGPIEHLHWYAWRAVHSAATSHVRRGSMRLIQKTLESEASEARLAAVQTEYGSVEQIERDILLREALSTLSPEEHRVCSWKKAGFSSQEIATFEGRSVVAVDTLFSRAKQKVRDALGITARASDQRTRRAPVNGRVHEPQLTRQKDTETLDGTHRSTSGKR